MPHRGTRLLGSSKCVTWSEEALDSEKSTSGSHRSQAHGLAGWLPAVCWSLSALPCVGRIPHSLSQVRMGVFPRQLSSFTERSPDLTAKPAPYKANANPRLSWGPGGSFPSNWIMAPKSFQKAPACWVLEIIQQRNKIQRHFSLDLLPSLFNLRWWGVDNSLFLVCFKFKA